jgi:hypothetical protein
MPWQDVLNELEHFSDGVVNTGNAAFLHNPVYISNADGGAMTFYGAASNTTTTEL